MPLPFIFWAGAAKAAAHATTALGAKAAAGAAKGAAAKGAAGKGSSSAVHAPPGTKSVLKRLLRRGLRASRESDEVATDSDDQQKNKSQG